jgi:hypothetical protein
VIKVFRLQCTYNQNKQGEVRKVPLNRVCRSCTSSCEPISFSVFPRFSTGNLYSDRLVSSSGVFHDLMNLHLVQNFKLPTITTKLLGEDACLYTALQFHSESCYRLHYEQGRNRCPRTKTFDAKCFI